MVDMPTRREARVPPDLFRSRQQEKRLAARVGGKVTRGSGNGIEKGDVRLRGVVRIEAKTTKAASFRVTDKMISLIEDAAVSAGELPVIVIELAGGPKPRTVCVVPEWVLDVIAGGHNGAS